MNGTWERKVLVVIAICVAVGVIFSAMYGVAAAWWFVSHCEHAFGQTVCYSGGAR